MNTHILIQKKIAAVILFLLLLHLQRASATTYYSRASGYWNASTSWSTVTYGDPTNTGTYPVIGDMVYVDDGHSILLTASHQCSGLTIGRGTSGIVEYPNFGTITLTVSGALTINNGGRLWYNYNNSRTHNLYVSTNITNNGLLDLYADNNDVVNLILNGAANSVISGSGSFSFNNVSLNKGVRTYYVHVTTAAFLAAAPPAATTYPKMDLVKGYLIYDTGTALTWSDPASTSLTIPMDVILEVRSGTLTMLANGDSLINSGRIYITGGTLEVCSTTGVKGILMKDAGTNDPELEITAGTLKCYGGLATYPGTNPWVFKLSGGTVDLNSGTTGTDMIPLYMANVTGSQYLMTGGIIYIRKPSTNSSNADFDFGSSNVYHNVTDGTVYFGNATTAYTFDYMPYVSYIYPHFYVWGNTGTILRPKTVINSRMLSLQIFTGNTFDISASGSNATSTQVTISSTIDGTYALYNDGVFEGRNGTLIMASTSSQTIYSPAGGNSYYNLTINNAAGVTIENPLTINGTLTFTSGLLYSSPADLLIINAGGNVAGVTDGQYVEGPVKKIGNTSFTFPIGKLGIYRPLSISAPSVSSDQFTAEYLFTSPDPTYDRTSHALSLDHISDIEYWTLTRDAGASSVFVTLTWNASSKVDDLPSLRIAGWDGSIWQDEGNGSTTGTITAGTITSSATTTTFNVFTLASSGTNNPLPVEFISFEVTAGENANDINWQTASEKNCDYFDIERTIDNKTFEWIARINGAGDANTVLNYHVQDSKPLKGVSCYRIKQVDNNGDLTMTNLKCIRSFKDDALQVSPTLIKEEDLNISVDNIDESTKIYILDIAGKKIFAQPVLSSLFTINNDDIAFKQSGIYTVRIESQRSKLFYSTKIAVVL